MELDKLWNWQRKKLACRIRQENGNPTGDGLREMFAELAGVDLNDLLNEMKTTKKKKEMTNKVTVDYEGEKTFKEVLSRSRVLGATKLALESMEDYDLAKANSVTNKNVRKVYQLLPKSPPKRVMLEIQRERSKPLRLPDQDEHKTATDKLEKKLQKQRAARMVAIEMTAKEKAAKEKTDQNESDMTALMQTCLPKYEGDMFSTGGAYLDGMLYLSRMADSSIKSQRLINANLEAERQKNDDNKTTSTAKNDSEKKDSKGADGENHGEQDDKDETEGSVNPDMNAKLNCAVSLCNWSRNPANAGRLASEGAVRAIIQLCNENVPRITVYCAAAFRYMSEHTELALSMIDEGAISTISDLVSTVMDDFVATNLAIALVNLTRINGKEAAVVDSAIVLALMNLIMIKPELGSTCVRGLYNLTCVDTHYLLIERVIRALVSLSLSGTSNVKHLCAAALCNLSDLKVMRPRMVEEGAINVLSALSRGAETRTRRVCAVILQNLSAAKSVRVEMASRNSVTAAYGLSSDQDPIILRCIGLTLSRLAMEPLNCQRIIHESGIGALCNIAVKYPTIPGITQPVASAFLLLSAQQAYRVSVVNEGSITAISSLLCSSVDMFTLQRSLLALCNLLCEPDNHLPIIQQGLIVTLITMCGDQDNDLIKDFCTLAFLNLSCAEESRKHLVNSGAIVAIIRTCSQNSEATRRRCAATLSNLTYYSVGMSRMVADGIIPSIVSLVLAKDILTVHYSCAALCRLCSTVENARLILESGAVTNLVQGAMEGDTVTKQFCGAVLSSLSFYESCRITLCELGAIAALKGLAELNDDLTKQRCLVAFANLSCEVTVQSKIINDGIVNVISELANSYQEINYICCAKAICNLACCDGYKLSVARDGGVHALLMISMVQSVDNLTKLLCVLGLNNLLDETTIQFMLSEGLVGSVANLSKIEDSNIANLSAKIFNNLSKNEDARAKICERSTALKALFRLCDSNAVETSIIAIRTCCNLLLDGHVRGTAMKTGALQTLERGIECTNSPETVLQCLVTTFSLCNDAGFMEVMSKTQFPAALISLASRPDVRAEEYDHVVKITAMLLWEEKSRLFLQTKEFTTLVFDLIQSSFRVEAAEDLAAMLRFLCLGFHDVCQLVTLGVIPCINIISNAVSNESEHAPVVIRYLIETLRTLCNCAEIVPDVATIDTLAILNKATVLCVSDEAVMYDVAVITHAFATNGMLSRTNTAVPEMVNILDELKTQAKCLDIIAVTVGTYLSDVKCRSVFCNPKTATIIVTIADTKPTENTISNLVLAIYAMAKVASCREFLQNPPIHIDRILTRFSLVDNPRIRANCNRANKNLNSDLNEAIEEGAVLNLIAISLEGKLKNQSSDEYIPPTIVPQIEHKIKAPACSAAVSSRLTEALWYEVVTVTKGGAAGKGPEPPEAPANSIDGSSAYPNMTDELDSGEAEGKTKMSFAKMQVPREIKEAHLLTDTDFMILNPAEKEDGTALDGGESSIFEAEQQAAALQEALDAQDAELAAIAEQHNNNNAASHNGSPKSRISRQGSGNNNKNNSGFFSRQRSGGSQSFVDGMGSGGSSGGRNSPSTLLMSRNNSHNPTRGNSADLQIIDNEGGSPIMRKNTLSPIHHHHGQQQPMGGSPQTGMASNKKKGSAAHKKRSTVHEVRQSGTDNSRHSTAGIGSGGNSSKRLKESTIAQDKDSTVAKVNNMTEQAARLGLYA